MAPLLLRKTLCLFEVPLPTASLPSCVPQLAVEFRLLDAATWAVQPYTSHIPDRRLFQARLERGEQFWTAQLQEKIVSYCWAAQNPVEIGEIRRVIHPRAGEIYLYDAFTFAEYRGRNLYPALLQHILHSSRQQGLQRALIFVLSDNTASLRGVSKAGFRQFQRIIYTNVLGIAWYTYRPRLPAAASVDLLPT